MNKRDFLAGASAGTIAAVCKPARAATDAAPAPTASRAPRLPPLEGRQSQATWQRYVGQTFAADSGALLRLRQLDTAASPGAGGEQFRLVFDAPAGAALHEGLQQLRHASGQRLSLYLDAAAAGELHAQFNLLI